MDSRQAIEILNNRKHLAYRGCRKEVWVHSLTNVEVGEIAALIERQEKQIEMYQATIRLQDEQIAQKDKLLDVYRTKGGTKG